MDTIRERSATHGPAGGTTDAGAVLIGRVDDSPSSDIGLVATWPRRAKPSPALLALARTALDEDRILSRAVDSATAAAPDSGNETDAEATMIVAVPIAIGRPPRRCALAVITPVALAAPPTAPQAPEAPPDPLDDANRPASAIRLLDAINGHDDLESASLALVSELARIVQAHRVSIGYVSGDAVQVVAMSNTARVKGRSPLTRDLSQAMDEAIDQAATLVYPAESGAPARVTLAHRRYVTRHGCALLCTVPILISNDRGRALIGAIALEFAHDRRLDSRAVRFIENIGSLLGPSLDARRRLAAPIAGRLASTLAGRPRELLRRGGRARRIALAVAATLLAAAALVPLPFHINAQARVEGATQQVMASPVAGYIGSVYARPGDRVLAGQPLVELDDRELRLERQRWDSELAQIQKRYGDALAREDQTEIAVQRARIDQAKAKIAIVDKQLARTRLVAHYDGMVIDGDLSQSLGAPVKRGETLMTIAPLGAFRVMLSVDERNVDEIAEGQRAAVLLPALPGAHIVAQLGKPIPVATLKAGVNVFEVPAQLTAPVMGLRPGLTGVARIEGSSRPLLAALTGDLVAWLRLQWWRWGP